MPSTGVLNNARIQSGRGKFELPALFIEPVSLTAGTNIPPPPESPIAEKPRTPQPAPESVSTVGGTSVNGHHSSVTEVYTGRGRTTVSGLSSPVSLKRPSSIRRFLSRKSLYPNYADGPNDDQSQDILIGDGFRPESPSAFSISSKSTIGKRGWFKRFTGSGFDDPNSRRKSIVHEEKETLPPPMLPELDQFKAKIASDDDGSLGGSELFKNIK